jgi:MFS transporter, DHA3 family, macrolide efflux protein
MNFIHEQRKEQWKREIVLFLTSQTISLFGSSLVQYAILWYITLDTRSGVMMTIYILCGFVPTFLLSPVAGVWADRFNRKMLIIGSDAMIAMATLILAILFLAGYDAIWLLFVISAVRAIGTGFQTPAVGAVLPQLVLKDQLTKVNGINGSLQSLIMLVSPMVSAALITMASIEAVFFVDVLTAAVAVFIMMAWVHIPVHEKASEKQKTSYYSDVTEGIAYIKKHAFLKSFFLFFAVFFVLIAPASFLTPLQVTRSFGDDVWRLTAIEITFSVGMMAGGGLIALWGGFGNKVHTMALSGFIMGVCTLALGLVPDFWIYLLVMGLFGVAMPFFNTPTTVLLQEKIEENYTGRVFGVFSMISTSMMPVGMLVFGPVADWIEIEWILAGTGLLMCMLAMFLGKNKVLLKAGKPA